MIGVPADSRPHCARLTLRRFTVADTPRVCEIQANWNVARMLRMAQFPPDPDDIAAWLAGHDAEWTAGTAFRFAVVAEGRLVGCADVDEITGGEMAGGAGEIGYWFDEAAWGRGYASEAAAAVVDFATATLGLRRLESGHAVDNPASGRVLTRLGFGPIGESMSWYRSRQREVLHRAYRRDAAGKFRPPATPPAFSSPSSCGTRGMRWECP